MTLLYKEFYENYSKRYGNNTCIFLMVGKFYELYASFKQTITPVAQSVKKATEIMNILLKEKQLDDGSTEYWSGFPEQSLHKFAQTLTREGWTVVVVDQHKEAGDVIDRIPTRILSPGTHVEIANQDRMSVASLWLDKQSFATSVLDLTTGEVFSYKTNFADEILHMYQVYCVKEVVVATDSSIEESAIRSLINITGPIQVIPQQNFSYFEDEFRREEFFRKLFRTRLLPVRPTLSLLPIQPLIEKALTVLLRFVEDHFPQQTEHLTTHCVYSPSHHMRLSNNILEQLNILTTNNQRSLLQLLDQTASAIGKRTLRERILRPITDPTLLQTRWTQVAFLQKFPNKQILERELRLLYDIPRLHHKVSSGSISSLEVLQMFSSYTASNVLMKQLQNTPLACPQHIQEQVQAYREHVKRLLDEEKASRREKDELVGFLTPIAGPKTTSFEVKIQTLSEEWTALWTRFSKEIGISPDLFRLVKKGDMEWSWEGPRSLAKVISGNAKASKVLTNVEVDTKKAGPVMVNSKEFEVTMSSLLSLWGKHEKALEKELEIVCDDLWTMLKPFQNEWIDWLGSVDATLSLANVAEQLKWCQPTISNKGGLSITGLRHPLLESNATRVAYVKHDVELGGENPNGWLIYGVNASGKSSLMKAVGIACILAQAGSFVPATTFSIRPYDAAYSRIWNHDNIWAGLSSFAVEVTELRDILMNATQNSLVLGDEVCSGTESTSATALVASTLEHLDKQKTHFMFATHLHDLMKIDGFLPRPGVAVWHLRVERTPDGKLIYDRRLQPGPGSSSYGLEVAHAMGIPLTVLERAHAIRRNLEGTASSNEAPKSSWNAKIQRHSCEVCGHSVVRDLEVHHIVQRSDGGTNELRNLAVLCEECHDKHHNGEITVGPLLQTSEGLERSTVTTETKKSKTKSKSNWSDEEETLIQTTIQKLKDRPLARVVSELTDQGIQITKAQLKKFIV